MSPWRLNQIARQISLGALIAYPTDTIWGLGCHPMLYRTVLRLQQVKRRPVGKGLILLSSSLKFLQPYIEQDNWLQLQDRKIEFPEKPVTWLVKPSLQCPSWLTGHSQRIAVRLSNVTQLVSLCNGIQAPLVSTSANISGRRPMRNNLQVHKHFRDSVDYIIEGFATGSHHASEIRDLETNEILRR